MAPTAGYENDVGNKTTMTTLNPSLVRRRYVQKKTKHRVYKKKVIHQKINYTRS